jgi:hypothetical protein
MALRAGRRANHRGGSGGSPSDRRAGESLSPSAARDPTVHSGSGRRSDGSGTCSRTRGTDMNLSSVPITRLRRGFAAALRTGRSRPAPPTGIPGVIRAQRQAWTPRRRRYRIHGPEYPPVGWAHGQGPVAEDGRGHVRTDGASKPGGYPPGGCAGALGTAAHVDSGAAARYRPRHAHESILLFSTPGMTVPGS